MPTVYLDSWAWVAPYLVRAGWTVYLDGSEVRDA